MTRTGTHGRFLLAQVVFAPLLGLLLPDPALAQTMLVSEDFASSLPAGWVRQEGSVAVSGGLLNLNDGCVRIAAPPGAFSRQSGLVFEADVRFVSAGSDFALYSLHDSFPGNCNGGPTNGYRVGWYGPGHVTDVLEAVSGQRATRLASTPVSMTTGRFYRLKQEILPDGRLNVYIDGVLKLSGNHSGFQAGQITLRGFGSVQVDNLLLRTAGTITPTPNPGDSAAVTITSFSPASVTAGGSLSLTLAIRNAGTTTWTPIGTTTQYQEFRYYAIAEVYDPSDPDTVISGGLLLLPRDVNPGETVSVQGSIAMPVRSGTFVVSVAMIRTAVYQFATRVLNSSRDKFDNAPRIQVPVVPPAAVIPPSSLRIEPSGGFQVATAEPVTLTANLFASGVVAGTIRAAVSSSAPWLVVTPLTAPITGNAPVPFQLRIAPPAEPGEYQGSVLFELRSLTANAIPIFAIAAVRLTVPSAPVRIEVSRDILSFVGSGAEALEVAVSSGASRSITVTATGSFLEVSPLGGTTPLTLNVSVAGEGLEPGTYDGAIAISAAGVTNSPLHVPVRLTIAPATQLTVFPSSLAMTGTSSTQVRVDSDGPPAPFRVETDQPWLSATANSRVTPAVITVNADAADRAPGSYSAQLTLYYNNDSSRVVLPVRLTVPPASENTSLVIVQTGLVFNHQINGEPPPTQDIVVSTTSGTLPVEVSATVASPPAGRWLRVTPERATAPAIVRVSITPIGLDAGIYEGAVTIRAEGGSSTTIPVRLVVSDPITSSVKADPEIITFAVTRQGVLEPQQLHLTNPGRNLLRVELETETAGGGSWLKTSTTRTDVNDSNPAFVLVQADPAGLEPGTYKGNVRIRGSSPAAATTVVPVVLNVSAAQRSMRLSHSGISFTAIEGFGTETQNVWVINAGQGLMNWTAAIAPSVAATSSWLNLAGGNGVSGVGPTGTVQTPNVLFAVNAAGLRPGEYYSEVVFRAPEAENGVQSVGVTLRVLPKGSFIGMAVEPAGIIFTYPLGGPAPSQRQVFVFNKTGENTDAFVKPFTLNGGDWLSGTPGQFPLRGETTSGSITLTANPQGLARGTYEGRVTVSFLKGVNRTINVLLVVYDPGAGALGREGLRAAGACTPSRYLPLLTSLEDQFVVSGGAPTSTEMLIVDDCGNPAPSANLGASFSNGDPARSLISPELGRWSSTWVPSSDTGLVTMRVAAIDKSHELETTVVPVTGLVIESVVAPVLAASQSVRNAASGKAEGLVGPGAMIEILGSRLATETVVVGNSTPPATLATTSLTIGDRTLPLLRVAPDRVMAIVPDDIAAGQLQHLVIRRGQTISTPHPVLVGFAAPGIFRQPESDLASAFVTRGGIRVPLTPANPAAAGDLIELECTGLGAVNTQDDRVRSSVSVLVGNTAIPASLAVRDRPGRYTVRFALPSGIAVGQVPIRVSTQRIASEPAMLPVR